MFGQAPRGGPDGIAYPQQSTSIHRAVREQVELPPVAGVRVLQIPMRTKSHAYQEDVMRLPIDRQSIPLPKRFPVGARYVVEGSGGEDGHLRVFSRYVVLPGGQRISVPSDLNKFGAVGVPARRGKRSQNGTRRTRTASKKIMRSAGTSRQHRS
jgi:hypothetical protein